MNVGERDRLVRAAAFEWLSLQVDVRGDILPIELLRQGFSFEGQRVPLMAPQGIFKPAAVPDVPISITTVPVVEGRNRPYEDEIGADGFLRYRYRGTNPNHPTMSGCDAPCSSRSRLCTWRGWHQVGTGRSGRCHRE